MHPSPAWLPRKYNTNGVWEEILEGLYHIFHNDFIKEKCYFDRHEINFDKRKIDSPYEEGFWHVISKTNKSTGMREPDFPRAQKLPWCKPCIENHKDQNIKCWDYEEGNGRFRTYIWLENFDYVVIIEKKRRVAFLVTAFHVSGSSMRRNLDEKYKNRVI